MLPESHVELDLSPKRIGCCDRFCQSFKRLGTWTCSDSKSSCHKELHESDSPKASGTTEPRRVAARNAVAALVPNHVQPEKQGGLSNPFLEERIQQLEKATRICTLAEWEATYSLSMPSLNHCSSCSICLSEINPDSLVRGLACGHVFHLGCVAEWFMRDQSFELSCPLCRKSLSEQDQCLLAPRLPEVALQCKQDATPATSKVAQPIQEGLSTRAPANAHRCGHVTDENHAVGLVHTSSEDQA